MGDVFSVAVLNVFLGFFINQRELCGRVWTEPFSNRMEAVVLFTFMQYASSYFLETGCLARKSAFCEGKMIWGGGG